MEGTISTTACKDQKEVNSTAVGDHPLYSLIRSRPSTASSFVKVNTEGSPENNHEGDGDTPRSQKSPEKTCLERQGKKSKHKSSPHKLTEKIDDDERSIKIHSLASDTMIIVPETSTETIDIKERRPQSSYSTKRPDSSRNPSERGFSLRQFRKTEVSSRPSTATSFTSWATSAADSCHLPIAPEKPLTSFSRSSSRTLTPSQHITLSYNQISDDKKMKEMRKAFLLPDQDEYNEWRAEHELEHEDDKTLKDISDEIYFKDFAYVEGEPHCRYGVNLGRLFENLTAFSFIPVAPGNWIRTRISRSKSGINGSIYPYYFMYFQKNGQDILVLSAKKTKKFPPTYIISSDPAEFSKKGLSCAGVLTSDFQALKFSLTTNKAELAKHGTTQELLSVEYTSNPLGFKGPRKMLLTVPLWNKNYEISATSDKLINSEEGSVAFLENRSPLWHPDCNAFILNFNGRVDIPSVKNFQIEHADIRSYLLQFGRMMQKNHFILDFGYPFSPIQAFATALSSFDVKWGLE